MTADTVRLFFAAWPDRAVREALQGIQARFPGGRPTHPDDLHVTLVFLGSVKTEYRACVTRVADGIRGTPFAMQIDRVSYWRRPRILWCGPTVTPVPMERLVEELQAGLKGCGFHPEKRPYAPHVTLARKARPAETQALPEPIAWQVSDYALVASHGGPMPPRYRVLKKWSLG